MPDDLKAKRIAYIRQWAAENADRIREQHSTPRAKAQKAAWQRARLKEPEFRARKREYYRRHLKTDRWREYYRLKASERRAKIRGNGGSVTRAEWREILECFGHACAYCLAVGIKLEMDHMHPISSGGMHVASNIVPACRSCNARKHDDGILKMVNA